MNCSLLARRFSIGIAYAKPVHAPCFKVAYGGSVNTIDVSPPRWCYDHIREEATSSIQQAQTGIGGEESDIRCLRKGSTCSHDLSRMTGCKSGIPAAICRSS